MVYHTYLVEGVAFIYGQHPEVYLLISCIERGKRILRRLGSTYYDHCLLGDLPVFRIKKKVLRYSSDTR